MSVPDDSTVGKLICSLLDLWLSASPVALAGANLCGSLALDHDFVAVCDGLSAMSAS